MRVTRPTYKILGGEYLIYLLVVYLRTLLVPEAVCTLVAVA
jgi:hypothetical protein